MRHSTNPWVVLVLVCLAQFMVVLDATVVNVALPSIQKDLGLSEANLQWVVNAYTLVFGGFLLLGGRAGDLLGRKRLREDAAEHEAGRTAACGDGAPDAQRLRALSTVGERRRDDRERRR